MYTSTKACFGLVNSTSFLSIIIQRSHPDLLAMLAAFGCAISSGITLVVSVSNDPFHDAMFTGYRSSSRAPLKEKWPQRMPLGTESDIQQDSTVI